MPAPRKRILYAVHGYGRGHAARAQAVLPELAKRYELKILAGDDAYAQLKDDWPITRIPVLRYYHGRNNRRSPWLTIKRNIPASLDLTLGGPIVQMVKNEIEAFGADVIVSDSEGWSHRAGKVLGLPRISFDHYGVMAFAKLDTTRWNQLACRAESLVYRQLLAGPDRIIAAAFYPGEPTRPGVRIVGPILRQLVRDTAPTDGDYLLVYFTNAKTHYTPAVESLLTQLDIPVRVFHPEKRGQVDNVTYFPLGNEPFVQALAGCKAVFATAGNQLASEAIHFGKPLLLLPEAALEQRLNADFIERWQIGLQTHPNRLSLAQLHEFLARRDEFAANIPAHQRNGLGEALDAIHTAIDELT